MSWDLSAPRVLMTVCCQNAFDGFDQSDLGRADSGASQYNKHLGNSAYVRRRE